MCSLYIIRDKDYFQNICSHKIEVLGLVIIRDVAIAKGEYQANESYQDTRVPAWSVVTVFLPTYFNFVTSQLSKVQFNLSAGTPTFWNGNLS